jgi:hypothetical protein
MNDKAKINITLEFASNELEQATETLNALIEENLMPANGELKAMSETINSIFSKVKKFKELLAGVKELDEKRKEFIGAVNEKKDEE